VFQCRVAVATVKCIDKKLTEYLFIVTVTTVDSNGF
jgi:hypothetical protein